MITEDTIIEPDIVCSEKHRAFFIEKINISFSFKVMFPKWLKSNAGKTYEDTINAYYQILEEAIIYWKYKKVCKDIIVMNNLTLLR